MLELLAQVVIDAGGQMEFDAFIAEARARGLRAELWLKAKHAGMLSTRIDPDGQHTVFIPPAAQGGG